MPEFTSPRTTFNASGVFLDRYFFGPRKQEIFKPERILASENLLGGLSFGSRKNSFTPLTILSVVMPIQTYRVNLGSGSTRRVLQICMHPAGTVESHKGLAVVYLLLDTSGSMRAYATLLEDFIRHKFTQTGIEVIIFSSQTHYVEPEEDGSIDWTKVKSAPGAWMQSTNFELALDAVYTRIMSSDSKGRANGHTPLIVLFTDGMPERGNHKAASDRLKAAGLPVQCVYFGQVTPEAHMTLSGIGTGTPLAIEGTSKGLENYITSVLQMRVQPAVDYEKKIVCIGGMEVSVVNSVAVDTSEVPPSSDPAPLTLPMNIPVDMAVQLATTMISFLRHFGDHYRDCAQVFVREVAQRVSPHGSSGAKGIRELLAVLVGDSLDRALRAQQSQPTSSEKNISTLLSMATLATGKAVTPNDPYADIFSRCTVALAHNPPDAFGLSKAVKRAGKVMVRMALRAEEKVNQTLPQLNTLLNLAYPRELLSLILDADLAAKLASPTDTNSAAAISVAGNSPSAILLTPGSLRIQHSLSDVATHHGGVPLILVDPVAATGPVCRASLVASMAQLNPYSTSTQANLAPATLLLYRYHTLESADATLIVLGMMHTYLASLPAPYFPTSSSLFDYASAAQQGHSPIVHALRSFFQRSLSTSASASLEPPCRESLLEIMLLFLHQLDLTCLEGAHVGHSVFVPENPPSRQDMLAALASQSGKAALVAVIGKVSLSRAVLSDAALVETLEQSIQKDRERAASRAPAGIWPGKFSVEDMVRLLQLVNGLAHVDGLGDKKVRDQLAEKTLLLSPSSCSLSAVLYQDTAAREAFFAATMLLYVAHQLIGPNQSAPDIRELFRMTGAAAHPDLRVSLDRLSLTSTGPSQRALGAVITEWFLQEAKRTAFTPDELALFVNLVDAKHLMDQVRAIVADGKVTTVSMATCIEFMRLGLASLCPYVQDISVSAVALLSRELASEFLRATRLPVTPDSGENVEAIALLLSKATSADSVHYLSSAHAMFRLALFTAVSTHPIEGFRPYLSAIAEDAKASPEVALALLKYNAPGAFQTWGPERLQRCLGQFEHPGTPSSTQRELLATLDAHVAADTLPTSAWTLVLSRLDREPYRQSVIQPSADDIEVARRWASAASCNMVLPTDAVQVTLSPEAILSWLRPGEKNARLCNFHGLLDIATSNQSAARILDSIVLWRNGRCMSAAWSARSKKRLQRDTLLLSLMRLARWTQKDKEWMIPTKISAFTGSALVVVHPDSKWEGQLFSKAAKQP